ncbi:MAG: phospholipase D-like domain-containing protein [Bacteroidia bacterium]
MLRFLNRYQIVEGIEEIIAESKAEIIMIVPFIKISPNIWNQLKSEETLSKEILLIYREDSMSVSEREKLLSLPNLTMMSHPNIHAKCYLNEHSLIICSMNLYEHSEKNNREMGFLVNNDNYEYREVEAYRDCIKEIRVIINASKLEKKSNKVEQNGFKFQIIEPPENNLKEFVDIINKIFVHKRFVIDTSNNEDYPDIVCMPYHENIIVSLDYDNVEDNEKDVIEIRRVHCRLLHRDAILKSMNALFWSEFPEPRFDQFNIYWDDFRKALTIYPNKKKYPQWLDLAFNQRVTKFKQGLDDVIDYIKSIEKRIK